MSQINYSTELPDGRAVDVMAGWDRPCNHFFLSVFDMSTEEARDEEKMVYATIFDSHPMDEDSTLRLQAKLAELGLRSPEGFWEKVELREGPTMKLFPPPA